MSAENGSNSIEEEQGCSLCACFFDSQGFMDKMNGEQYEEAFAGYLEACEPVIIAVDRKMQNDHGLRPEALADSLANRIIGEWEKELSENPRKKRSELESRDRMFLALYLIPMILETGVQNAGLLAEAVRDEWHRRYPKTTIVIGRYAEIAAGFHKKPFGMCFITTAVCEFAGKPDDCPELTMLRRFRDQYMMQTSRGQALVRQYYEIAPQLVTAINFCSDRRAVYERLRVCYIEPCLALLEDGDFPACQDHYCAMVQYLTDEFGMAGIVI